MYTEYVFENKRYEVASREIKATLFDIVTTEEEKIAKLREKAFVDATDSRQAAELQSLYVQQDACLRDILSISDKLTKSLQRVDTCSRKLKQIEDKNIAQIIATIHDTNEAQQMMAMQPQQQVVENVQPEVVVQAPVYENPVVENNPVMVADEGDSYAAGQVSSATDVAMAPEPVDEPVVTEVAPAMDAPVVQEVMEVPNEVAPATDAPVAEVVTESTPTADAPVASEVIGVPSDVADKIEEKKERIIRAVVDVPDDFLTGLADASQTETQEPVASDAPVEVQKESTEEGQPERIIRAVVDVPDDVPTDATEVTATTSTEVSEQGVSETTAPSIIEVTEPAASENVDVPEMVGEVSTEEVATDTNTEPLIITETEASTESSPETAVEETSGPLIAVETDAPQETSSGPLIPIEENTATESSGPLIPIEEDTTSNTQVITISSDGPLEATSGGPLIPVDGTVEASSGASEMAIPEIVPNVEENTAGDTLVFKKRTNDPPKVIMISGKQAANLKKSLPTQEALLSAKGFFKSEAPAGDNLEQQLINNGLLEPDTAAKQAQIEQMMTQANELYAAGKVDEAQTMYNQISELNKELQGESAGIAK